MCLVLIAINQHQRYKFVVAANRDEYYSRSTESAHFWPDCPHVLAGRDNLAKGTWGGINTFGRFAAITNHPTQLEYLGNRSRGELVRRYLEQLESSLEFRSVLKTSQIEFNGYGLIFGQITKLSYFSNRTNLAIELKDGIHGLSNHVINHPWHRVEEGKLRMKDLLSNDSKSLWNDLFDMLADDESNVATDRTFEGKDDLQQIDPARLPIFVRTNFYGTRCSTVILVDHEGKVQFEERSFDPNRNRYTETKNFEFELERRNLFNL